MRVDNLIEELKKYPPDANARAYEGEVCGIIIEAMPDAGKKYGKQIGLIEAHESESCST